VVAYGTLWIPAPRLRHHRASRPYQQVAGRRFAASPPELEEASRILGALTARDTLRRVTAPIIAAVPSSPTWRASCFVAVVRELSAA